MWPRNRHKSLGRIEKNRQVQDENFLLLRFGHFIERNVKRLFITKIRKNAHSKINFLCEILRVFVLSRFRDKTGIDMTFWNKFARLTNNN
jgi:hypothetical protein